MRCDDMLCDSERCVAVLCVFFQAEDGIRDHCVTGVQTCALPISEYFRDEEGQDVLLFVDNIFRFTQAGAEVSALLGRSEERRVGKECRARGSRWLCKNNVR